MGRAPFGFQWKKFEKRFEIDELDAEAYRFMVDKYLAGNSMSEVATLANEKGY